jgi:hypothetical protein
MSNTITICMDLGDKYHIAVVFHSQDLPPGLRPEPPLSLTPILSR